MRGEEAGRRLSVSAIWESPPHARGRGSSMVWRVKRPRITPAYAGKRGRRGHHLLPDQNHPRMHGEEPLISMRPSGTVESPPHARGREICETGDGSNLGITPACAGKRRETFSKPLSVRNHPRMRGEESNENAASEDMAIPPKSGFSAPFQEPPPSAA